MLGRVVCVVAVLLVLASPAAAQHRPHVSRPRVAAHHRPSARSSPPARYAVILVLDGSRPDYFNLVPMPHLTWLERHGTTYTRAMVGQEIAITPTSHATIGTGVSPRDHGVQGFMWKDPLTDSMTRPTDPQPLQQGALEAVMRRHHVPSIAASVKATDPSARIVAVSGHKCYASDAMGTAAADYILCSLIYHDRWVAQAVGAHRPPPGAVNNSAFDVPIPPPDSGFAPAVEQWNLGQENDWTIRYALWAFHRVHYPRVLMVNLPETDVIGHFTGDHLAPIAVLMRHFDTELGQVVDAYRRAGIFKRTVFLVTADHGMSFVQSRVPFSIFDQAIQRAGATKVFLEADTGAALGIKELDKARAVAQNVARLGGSSIDATYYKVHQGRSWFYRPAYVRRGLSTELARAYRYLQNTAAAADGPDVMTVYAPHTTTGDRPARGYHWMGGHLGPQWDDQHILLIIAGPGVRANVRSGFPARLVDIAPTVEHLLGAPSGRVDGIVLADALRQSDRSAAPRQQKLARLLIPFAQAIARRSGYR